MRSSTRRSLPDAYLRVDTEVLSLHLAKITSTMTYGVRAKCEPGCIGDDKEEEIEGTVASNEKDKIGKTLDPLGPAPIRHLPEDGFILEDVAFVETEGESSAEMKARMSTPNRSFRMSSIWKSGLRPSLLRKSRIRMLFKIKTGLNLKSSRV